MHLPSPSNNLDFKHQSPLENLVVFNDKKLMRYDSQLAFISFRNKSVSETALRQ